MRLLWISLLFMPLLVNGQPSKVTYAYDDAGRLALVDYGNAGNLIRSEAKSSAAVRKSKDASKPSAEQSGQTKPAKKEK